MRAFRFSNSVLRTLSAPRRPATPTLLQQQQHQQSQQQNLPAAPRRRSSSIVAMASSSRLRPRRSAASTRQQRPSSSATSRSASGRSIAGFDAVAETSSRLVRGAQALGLPAIVVTEQYPKALGPTVDEIASVLSPPPSTSARRQRPPSSPRQTSRCWSPRSSSSYPHDKIGDPLRHRGPRLRLADDSGPPVQKRRRPPRVDGISSQRLLDREFGLSRAAQAGLSLLERDGPLPADAGHVEPGFQGGVGAGEGGEEGGGAALLRGAWRRSGEVCEV